MINIYNLLFVGLGGFIGAAARYTVCCIAVNYTDSPIPAGTLIVNAAGSFLIGAVAVALQGSHNYWKLFIITGILGGFTTFSAFSHETMTLINGGHILYAFFNIALNILLCLAFVFFGLKLAKFII